MLFANLAEQEKQKIREDARFLEALMRFRHLVKNDPEVKTPEFREQRERLAERFVQGMYYLNYHKELGRKNLEELIRFQGKSPAEAGALVYFALCVLRLRRQRKEKARTITHLRVAGEKKQ